MQLGRKQWGAQSLSSPGLLSICSLMSTLPAPFPKRQTVLTPDERGTDPEPLCRHSFGTRNPTLPLHSMSGRAPRFNIRPGQKAETVGTA